MITLNLQLFAKSAAYQSDRRQAKRKTREELKPKEEKKKPEPPKKREKGDIVTFVRPDDQQYEIYKIEDNKEVGVRGEDGKIMTRTGKQILQKFHYDKERGGWISNAKGRKYIIRRRR